MDHKEDIFYDEGGETLGEVTRRSCGCPFTWTVQNQVAQGVTQPVLEKDVSVRGRGVGQDGLEGSFANQIVQ